MCFRSIDHQQALATAHEIGHQLGVAFGAGADEAAHRNDPPNNLMSGLLNEPDSPDLPAADRGVSRIFLHPLDVATIRRRVFGPLPPA